MYTVNIAIPHSQSALESIPSTDMIIAIKTYLQEENTHNTQKRTAYSPGTGDQGDLATVPHRIPTT